MRNQIDMTVTCIVIYKCDEVETSMPHPHIHWTTFIKVD